MITITKILEQVYILKDSANNCANLLIGKEKALLFDTGCGIDDMFGVVKTITNLPLLVIASHGHFDHIGGSYQFKEVCLSKYDFPILKDYSDELINKWLQKLDVENSIKDKYKTNEWKNIVPLNFESFDLGDMKCEVIPLPGHTKGSIGIYVPCLKLLLSGDALTPIMCLNFQNHESKEIQYETLKKLKDIDFDSYITSHHDHIFSKSMIDQLMKCIKNSKNKRYYEYQYPYPPYSKGWLYVDSVDEEIAIIVEKLD